LNGVPYSEDYVEGTAEQLDRGIANLKVGRYSEQYEEGTAQQVDSGIRA